MIGDSAAIDIMFGKKNGVRTLLVETGKNNLKDVENWLNCGDYDKVPDYFAFSLGTLAPHIRNYISEEKKRVKKSRAQKNWRIISVLLLYIRAAQKFLGQNLQIPQGDSILARAFA